MQRYEDDNLSQRGWRLSFSLKKKIQNYKNGLDKLKKF